MPDCEQYDARLENLPRMLEQVTAWARRSGLDSKKVRNLELAAEEALVNVCTYAYGRRPGRVTICCRPRGDGGLELEISDRGRAFDPLGLPEPDLDPDVGRREVGGLGIFMLRRLADRVTYRRSRGRNVLTLEMTATRGN